MLEPKCEVRGAKIGIPARESAFFGGRRKLRTPADSCGQLRTVADTSSEIPWFRVSACKQKSVYISIESVWNQYDIRQHLTTFDSI